MSDLILLAEQSDNICPECGAIEISYSPQHGYYQCQKCLHVWGFDKDDPDYDEVDDELEVFDHEEGAWKKIRVKADEL